MLYLLNSACRLCRHYANNRLGLSLVPYSLFYLVTIELPADDKYWPIVF
jgi:hypothetical protein